jgi:hypothetical protein
MSAKRSTIRYGVAAAALAILIIAAATYFIGSPAISNLGSATAPSSTSGVASPSLLVVQLTDPPQVPTGTVWLNMTYTELSILVGEPTGTSGQMTTETIPITPPGGSATPDLLKLQNVSQTIGSTSLPDGSVLYSATFTVKGISIDVAGTVSSVVLATGNTFTVTLSSPHALHGTNLALLRLEPVVVDTPSGYSLIPSSEGVIRPSEGVGEQKFGFNHQLTFNDNWFLNLARGSSKANLLALSVSGTTTTVEVQVNNTGSVPLSLDAIGIQGNFSASGSACPMQQTTTTTSTHTMQPFIWCGNFFARMLGVVFVPVVPSTAATTTTSTSCSALSMQLVNTIFNNYHIGGLTLAPGECVDLTFTGTISFMGSSIVLVPNTHVGQDYWVHVVASNGGSLQLHCTLPTGKTSCTPVSVSAFK